ncbi:MAG: DNA repair protein RecO [Gammaproteobacteria bacterium]|nr:DNA repair protein RecO [Gammaproteobacteria bacterium]
MKIEFASAFILHQRPFRESSRLLDVFTEHHGRVNLFAKGVSNNKRSQKGVLQIYQPLLLSWMGQSDLATVTAVEAESAPYLLTGHASLCGLYINELLVRLFPRHIAEPDLFYGYKQVLAALDAGKNIEIALRLFEKQLLTHIGYGLVLDHEVETELKIADNKDYYYRPDAGLFCQTTQSNYPTISGRSLRHLITETDFDQQSLNEIKKMMRSVIHFYLDGKPLQSRQLFAQMQTSNS